MANDPKIDKQANGCASFIVFILIAFIVVKCFTTDDTPAKPIVEKKLSASVLLGVLDYGKILDTNDYRIIIIKSRLAQLSTDYGEPIDTIAEYTSKLQSMLKENHKIDYTCNELLRYMLISSKEVNKSGNVKYKEAVILYAMLVAANQ